MSTPTHPTRPTTAARTQDYVVPKPLRIVTKVTAALVSLQLVLIIGDIVGFTELATFHGHTGYLSLTSAIVAMVLAVVQRPRGLGQAETMLAVVLPVLMCFQLFLNAADIRGVHMFLGGVVLLDAWVVAALIGGKPRAAGTPRETNQKKL